MTAIGGTDASGNISRLQAELSLPPNCDTDNEAISVRVAKDGYVQQQAAQGANYQTDAQNSYTITDVRFSHKAIVVNELNSSLTPDSATAGLNDVACAISGSSIYCAVALADDDTLDATTAYTIVKDGYVTAVPNLAGSRAAASTAQQVLTLDATNGLDFSHKIVVKDELNSNLTPDSATAGGAGVACTVSTNNVYCPVLLADDNTLSNGFSVVKDGYVTAAVDLASNRTAGTDARVSVTMDATNGLDFSHKVVVVNELGSSITPDSVTAGANDTSCTISGSSAYCPVPLADDNTLDSSTAYAIAEDGYVTGAPNLGGSRSTGSTAQNVVTLDNTTGLDFAFKVTGVTDELSNALSSVTVESGNSFGVSCTESGSAWYCATPLAHTGTSIRVTKSGYITNSATSFDADRTSATDAQQTKAVSSILFRMKVVVLSNAGSAVSGATVTHGGTSPADEDANTYYFTTTASGALAASKSGYDSLSTSVDTGLASISTNSTAQTVITLTGSTPYTGADPVGTSVTGSGLAVAESAASSGESRSSGSMASSPVVISSPQQEEILVDILLRIRDLLIQLLALYGIIPASI